MYKKILVALENSQTDRALLPHVAELARRFQSELLLIHVADGWAARNYDRYNLADSEEMKADRDFLERTAEELRREGLAVSTHLALGDPSTEILRSSEEQRCDLIAMTTHGHRFIADLVLGSTIEAVRHKSLVPVFLVHARAK
jgi:nucleotide-binding universal stress UspA family protein